MPRLSCKVILSTVGLSDFMQRYPDLISEDNAMRFLSDDGGETYNLCHFWSNFEIGDLNFWRSPAYMAFFEHLEKAGGFYYEVLHPDYGQELNVNIPCYCRGGEMLLSIASRLLSWQEKINCTSSSKPALSFH